MAGKKVLVVDDSRTHRKMLAEALADIGCEIAGEAEDGQQAVDLYPQVSPDLVILDVEMPRMHGVEALKRLIALDPSATVIMCTAVANTAVIDDCLAAGAADYIRKDRLADISDRLAPFLA